MKSPNLRKANKTVGSAVLENTVSEQHDNQKALQGGHMYADPLMCSQTGEDHFFLLC